MPKEIRRSFASSVCSYFQVFFAQPLMTRSLEDLPSELLTQIVSYAENARTLLYLALACKKLHKYIQSNDGYRAFVQRRYPSLPTPPAWREAAHGLTTLSRAWDRKSIVARCLRPPSDPYNPRPQSTNRRPRGQTMGYQPVIDSYETCTGTDWTSRREVVAWGAGAELVVRVRWMGQSIEEQWQSARRNKASITEFDQHHHRSRWWRIVETTHREGQDDITAVKVLRNSQRPSQSREYIISGRASGGLDMVSIDHAVLNVWKKEACFITEGHHVRSASVNSAEQPLLAACIDDHTVAIYSVAERQDPIPPLEKIKLIHLNASKESSRALSTVFLRQDRLAISYGPSIEPIRVFEINPAAVSSRLVRTFSLLEGGKTDGNEKYREMVYPLVPLPQSAFANAAEGDLFLSGCYDGTIRLHDLRSPSSYIACFTDIVDPFCAIYSLLPLSCGRLIAGSSNLAMLKVFNIHTELENHCRRGTLKHTEVQSPHNVVYGSPPDDPARDLRNGRDWNVFLTDRGRFASMQSKTQRGTDSPVYSLSSPSPYSPTIFAGLEGQVIQLDFTSVYDRFPDPIFGFGSKLSRRGEKSAMHQRDVARKWNPDHEVMCLAMYEQVTGVPMLRQQVPVGEIGDEIPGWDERWRHPSKRRRWE